MADNSDETATVTPIHGRGKLLKGGKKGNKGGGRRPQSFATFLRGLRESPNVQEAIQRAAEDETSRGFMPVLKTLTEYDTEKPAEKHSIVGPVEVRVRIEREGRRVTSS